MSAAGGPVTAVVPHYADPAGLARVLTALDRSTYDLADLLVVVADDGSPQAPQPGPRPYDVRVVRQDDHGFRAAAARNLGAREARGDVIVFVDGDTVPEPDFVTRMAAACRAGATSDVRGRSLVVGRRRHADLTGLDTAATAEFVSAAGKLHPERVLPAPAWLERGYADTDNLRAADDRSYRFVISAVLAVSATLWEAVGGFDESFVGYGGEDWEFAHRCRLAGARFVHEPRAVAWHDGADAAGRAAEAGASDDDVLATKNAEIRRLAELITEPGARDPGLLWSLPDVAVHVDARGWHPAEVLLTCSELVRGTDARVWCDGDVSLWPATDPRVSPGDVPADVLARCRYRVRVDRPVRLRRPLADVCAHGSAAYPGLTVRRTRDIALGREPEAGDPDVLATADDPSLEAEWGWRRAARRGPDAGEGS